MTAYNRLPQDVASRWLTANHRKVVIGLVGCACLLAVGVLGRPSRQTAGTVQAAAHVEHRSAETLQQVASPQTEAVLGANTDPAWLNGQAQAPDELEVITVATTDGPALQSLIASSPYKVTVLGLGESWEGYRVKLFPLIPYLREKEPDALVLILDAFDIVFLPNCGRDLVATYKEMQTDIVFNAETNVWPDPWKRQYYPQDVNTTEAKGPVPMYLNSGAYMGRAKDVLHYLLRYFLEEGQWNQPNFDDQRFWTDLFLASRYAPSGTPPSEPTIGLDLQGRLFQLLNPPSVRAAWSWELDPVSEHVSTPDGPYKEPACLLHGPSHKADFWDVMYSRLQARKQLLYSQQLLDDYDEAKRAQQAVVPAMVHKSWCKLNPFRRCL